MASSLITTSRSSSDSSWTPRQDKQFEVALAMFDKDSPDRWHNIARATGKSVEDVKRHYEILVRDIMQIESGQVPLPNYRSTAGVANEAAPEESKAIMTQICSIFKGDMHKCHDCEN